MVQSCAHTSHQANDKFTIETFISVHVYRIFQNCESEKKNKEIKTGYSGINICKAVDMCTKYDFFNAFFNAVQQQICLEYKVVL